MCNTCSILLEVKINSSLKITPVSKNFIAVISFPFPSRPNDKLTNVFAGLSTIYKEENLSPKITRKKPTMELGNNSATVFVEYINTESNNNDEMTELRQIVEKDAESIKEVLENIFSKF